MFVDDLQLEALLTCQALNLGRSWWTVSSQVATLANFYLTTWEEYHTGLFYPDAYRARLIFLILRRTVPWRVLWSR